MKMSYQTSFSPASCSFASSASTYTGDGRFGHFSQSSTQIDLVTWLKRVQYHASTGAAEDQRSLIDLATNLPDTTYATAEVRTVIEKIQHFMTSRIQYDKTLTPTSYRALRSLMVQLSPPTTHKPSCAKKLTFSGDDDE